VQGDGIFRVATLMFPCVLKALVSFETSQNSDPATQCHISEDPNTHNSQSVRCGKLKSVTSRRFRMASECRLMAGHGAERRAGRRVFVMCASDHHYRHHPIARTLRGFIHVLARCSLGNDGNQSRC
jgi:hypothetical protein